MVKDKLTNAKKFLQDAREPSLKMLKFLLSKLHYADPKDNTKQRIVTAAIVIPFALYAILFSKNAFLAAMIAAAILMTVEWLEIIKNAKDQTKWRVIGFFYILIPIFSVIKICFYDSEVLFWMFAVIWATDICAFFTGRICGGAKIAPSISPNKTWSGLVGGVVASIFVGVISSLMFKGGVLFFVFFSVFLSLLEQVGDFFESKIKRIFKVKDSGNIFPGHGGVLDRLDGMMFVAPAVLALITLFSTKF
jgi:phosphatidate cytidylyltransferase